MVVAPFLLLGGKRFCFPPKCLCGGLGIFPVSEPRLSESGEEEALPLGEVPLTLALRLLRSFEGSSRLAFLEKNMSGIIVGSGLPRS